MHRASDLPTPAEDLDAYLLSHQLHKHTHTTRIHTSYACTHHAQAQHDGLQSGHRWPPCSVELNSAVIAADDNAINHDIFGTDGRKEQRYVIKSAEPEIIHGALKQLNLNSLGPWITIRETLAALVSSKNRMVTSECKSSALSKHDKYFQATSSAL